MNNFDKQRQERIQREARERQLRAIQLAVKSIRGAGSRQSESVCGRCGSEIADGWSQMPFGHAQYAK
ncbi:hypothetical protein CMUS01_10194 [Colletotrichum musicola]|uniref:Uncharacterized protein n=1 Tax=Colletotrichum musicola TaxID=2175873 RepID=A0A8H6K3V8_9PEZI|nr:hypothetical protein CMUS01_10194 [Colletotrichum musicola]